MTATLTRERRKPGPILLVAPCIAMTLAGCADPSQVDTPSNVTPISALHDAVSALEKEPSYGFVFTDSPGTPSGGRAVYRVTIERPDRIAITGTLNVIAIGATAYSKTPYGWTTVHHGAESANYTNAMLADINILKRATSVNRHGDIYTVPPVEAATLLATTGLSRFQAVTGVAYSATVESGLIRSVSLHVEAPSPISDTIVVSSIGSSSAITVPRPLIN
jgi:hypothetical protein